MRAKHFIVFFIFIFGIAYSNHSLGIKSGLNISKTEYRHISDRNFIATPSIEICYNSDFHKNNKLGIAFLYSEQGLAYNSIWTDSLGVSLGTFKNTMKFHYFSIPIKIGYKIENIILSVGVDPSFFIIGTVRGPDIDNTGTFIGYKTDTFNHNGVNKFDLGIFFEWKIDINLSDKFILSPVIRYRHGLINVFKENHFYIKHRGLSLSICLGYHIL